MSFKPVSINRMCIMQKCCKVNKIKIQSPSAVAYFFKITFNASSRICRIPKFFQNYFSLFCTITTTFPEERPEETLQWSLFARRNILSSILTPVMKSSMNKRRFLHPDVSVQDRFHKTYWRSLCNVSWSEKKENARKVSYWSVRCRCMARPLWRIFKRK